MNKSHLAIFAVLVAAAAILYSLEPTNNSQNTQYLSYLRQFNKPVPAAQEMVYRARIFAEYVAAMEKHNADSSQTYKMGVNQFSDLTRE